MQLRGVLMVGNNLILGNEKAHMGKRDACMKCGACARNCPVEAIAVQSGVGCAQAVINTVLKRDSNTCRCVIESDVQRRGPAEKDYGQNNSCC